MTHDGIFSRASLLICWVAVLEVVPGISSFLFFYGFTSGAIMTLYTTVLATISLNLRVVGFRLRMCSLASGCGYLVGPLTEGAQVFS